VSTGSACVHTRYENNTAKAGTPLVFGICEMFAERKKRPKKYGMDDRKTCTVIHNFFCGLVGGT